MSDDASGCALFIAFIGAGLIVVIVLLTTVASALLAPFGVTLPDPLGINGSSQISQPAQSAETGASNPRDLLSQEVAHDRPTAERILGLWVPQVSSKSFGMVVGGTKYDYAAILSDFQATKSRFPNSILLKSEDYSTYSRSGYWVTVVAVTFQTADQANAWCTSTGLGPDDCFAHRLSHTLGPAGSSKRR